MKFSIILLALTIDDQTYNMNVSCISSFLESALEAAVDCEVVLVESNSSANYDYIITKTAFFNAPERSLDHYY